MRRALSSVLALGLIIGIGLGCGDSLLYKKPDISRFVPSEWQPSRFVEAEVRVARIRVYGDHEHRAQTLAWNRQFKSWVANANQLLVPHFGVRLEVVEFQPWTREASSDDLADMLRELEELDSGADVEWVVGVVTALPTVSPSIHTLGTARPLGRHVVIRGHNDVAERKVLSTYDGVTEGLFLARKDHKQAALLLHEIGHTLGALHVREPEDALLQPAYDVKFARFTEANTRLMDAVLAERLRQPGTPSAARERRALAAVLDQVHFPGWSDTEYESARAWLASASAGDESSGADAPQSAGPNALDKDGIPTAARANFAQVQGLVRQHELEQAWTELENLMTAYPSNVAFRGFACRLWLEREGPKDNARAQCQRVGELEPANPAGDITLAAAYVKDGRNAEAHAALEVVLERLPAMPSDADRQAAFDATLVVYQAMYGLSYIDQAVARAPAGVDTSAARGFVSATRRRYGVPPDGARHRITPEREGEYVRRVREVLEATYGQRYPEARKLAKQGLRDFPDGPGFSGALCDLEYRKKAFGAARAQCAAALRHFGEASWPRYLMGILELRQKRNRAGITHLQKAIESDPELRQAYHALYQAYARVKDVAAQSELRAAYYERFGTPLPAR